MLLPFIEARTWLLVSVLLAAGVSTAGGASDSTTSARHASLVIRDQADAFLALEQGRWAEAEAWARLRLEEAEATSGPESIEAAGAIEILVPALVAQGKGRDPAVSEMAPRALRIMETFFGRDSLELVPALRALSDVAGVDRDAARQVPPMQRALAILEREYGRDDERLVPVLARLATMFTAYGPIDQGIAVRQRIFEIEERAPGPNAADVALASHEVAKAAWQGGQYQVARTYLDRSLAIQDNNGSTRTLRYASDLNLLGILQMEDGDFSGARQSLEAALRIRERLDPPQPSEIGQSLNNLGGLLRDIGDFGEARHLFERTIDIWLKDRGEDPEVAYARMNLGGVLNSMGDFKSSRVQYDAAIQILDRLGGAKLQYYGPALAGLGEVLVDAHEYDKAKKVLEQALTLLQERLGRNHPDVAATLGQLARVDEAQAHDSDAKDKVTTALGIREEILGPNNPLVADSLGQLARISSRQARWDEAIGLEQRATRLMTDHLRLTTRSLPESQALRYATICRARLNELLEISAESTASTHWPEVFDSVIRSRALVFDEMAMRHRTILGASTPEIARLSISLDKVRNRLTSLILRGPESDDVLPYRNAVATAVSEKESNEKILAERSAAFRQATTLASAGFAEIRKALPEDAALVAFVRYGHREARYGAFILRGDTCDLRFVGLDEASRVDQLIEAWQQEASAQPPKFGHRAEEAETRYLRRAGQLREAVWDPIAQSLGNAKRILVVPEGQINLVNFATLPTTGNSYLVETGPLIQYLSAERDLLKPAAASLAQGELIAFGGPDFDSVPRIVTPRVEQIRISAASTDTTQLGEQTTLYRGPTSTCPDFRTMKFGSLPLAVEEVKDVSEMARVNGASIKKPEGFLVLTGAAATETAFKVETPRYRVVHVATHGFFLDPRCVRESGDSDQLSGLEESPLLRSGLVFAGANHLKSANAGVDDGILTAEEIAALDLSGVEWVVLSACVTGVGPTQEGEGVLGMRRAFGIAGAGALISSLWDVTDESARAWMLNLYKCRLAGMSTSAAAREASRLLLASQRAAGKISHPFYWGAFVASGDPR